MKSFFLLILILSFKLSFAAEASSFAAVAAVASSSSATASIFAAAAICPPTPAKKRRLLSTDREKPRSIPNQINSVAYIPGAFNPPHKSHLNLVRRAYEDMNHVTIVFYTGDRRHGIDFETSKNIWRIYLRNICEAQELALKDKDDPDIKTFEFKEDEDHPHEFIFYDLISLSRYHKDIEHIFVFGGDERTEGKNYELSFSDHITYASQNVTYRLSPKNPEVSATKFSKALREYIHEKDSDQAKTKVESFLPDELTDSLKTEIITQLTFDLERTF